MDQIKGQGTGERAQGRALRKKGFSFCVLFSFLLAPCSLSLVPFFSGCATTRSAAAVTPTDRGLQAVAVDIYQNRESRSAAEKILGVGDKKPVMKYSPVTGKHYSGDLEFDPETGVRLEVVPE
ncbi:MAG: hypothetical protein GX606_05735 [Elusimicrobia bacterium]|nr:hypothetical protein [Elusimicrobiota bacterium]